MRAIPYPVILVVLTLASVLVSMPGSPAAEADRQSNDRGAPPNAADGVQYIGSQRCAACHEHQHTSFLETLHSKAAQPTDISDEPSPGQFDHAAGGNRYEVDVVDGALLHREQILSDSGREVAVSEKTMDITLGSGTNAKSYLCREGPFHIQSPVTWYRDGQQWSLSPGYDEAGNRSFRRTVTVSCVFCHVGTITQTDRNPYKFEIVEGKIGCERCHGPGQLHEQRHLENPNWIGPDDTIVNPESLSRELSEAICQQCHCQGVQAVNVSQKNDWDFRPGFPLTDFRVDFQFRRGDNSMRLVGHVEQMHGSKCYTETESLTCVTCHDPHDPPPEQDRVGFFRDKCYGCHDDDACGKPHAERLAANENDCTSCHMPRGETNIAHFALHDHRIGIHNGDVDRSTDDAASFQPILDISYLPEAEQQRLLGLAKYEIHRRHGGNPKFAGYDIQAIGELIQLKQAGRADADVDAALAWLARSQGQAAIAEDLAREILASEKQETMPRIVATHILAELLFTRNDFNQALPLYRTLDGYHRDGRDTYYLGLSEQNMRNTENAIKALQRSIEIEPSQVAAHAALHAIYLSLGKTAEADKHRRAAEANQSVQQRYARRKRAADGSNLQLLD